MLKYLPATFGLAVLLIASTAFAEERRAQKQFVNQLSPLLAGGDPQPHRATMTSNGYPGPAHVIPLAPGKTDMLNA